MLGLDRQTETVILRRTEVSDLNFTVERPLQVEQNGELVPVASNPAIDRLTPFQTEMVALNLINGNPRLTEDLIRTGSCDSSYSVADQLRFRVNVFSQRGRYSIVMRKLNTDIPSLTQLQLPEIFRQVAQEKTGLVLVTGATGSGKSTTLAAILNEINLTKSVHIITLEDPVEFVHPHKKSTFNQREMGSDFTNFATGLRAALRQAPKVVLVGEMRDRETVEIGLARGRNGPSGPQHAPHHRCRTNGQPHSGDVRTGRTGTDSHPSFRHTALGHQPAPGAKGWRRTVRSV